MKAVKAPARAERKWWSGLDFMDFGRLGLEIVDDESAAVVCDHRSK
jgi:hypothetical protein